MTVSAGISTDDVRFEPVGFDALPGWDVDDALAAFETFAVAAKRLLERDAAGDRPVTPPALLAAARAGLEQKDRITTPAAARAFFEHAFRPHRVIHAAGEGLLTGYYEPVIPGSRLGSERHAIPILRRPDDLINLVAESERGAKAESLTHARATRDGYEPYATRAEIESGALDGRDLELVWLEDPVDAFFLHVQGSGVIAFEDGTQLRITYDGKNGHPYTSVGRYLIDAGLFPADQMSLDALKTWLRAEPGRGRAAMHQNRSYVFFRPLEGAAALGAMEIPLTPGRSLAVDTRWHALGTPVYVSSPTLSHAGDADGFHRLMIAQDVGSAIRGPERGDIYFGTGDAAGALAGITKHPGQYAVLLPATLP